jgi:hypothetical protein
MNLFWGAVWAGAEAAAQKNNAKAVAQLERRERSCMMASM